ncbi:MAG: hypothetical protein K0R55_262 [Sporomusa sp.]|jgi:Na+/H+ antiporter NhaD/arsenite permease-like protein|nr:hypothetical protein [Sporomusa sp.]
MGVDAISLLVLCLVIFIGYRFKVNTGLLGLAAAFILGFFVFQPIVKGGALVALSSAAAKAKPILAGWNTNLFLVITGITLLFSIARANGTLELITNKAVALVRGNKKLLPVMFFLIAAVISGIGPGNVSTGALLWPLAAAVAVDEGVSVVLMCLAVHAGINVGGLSTLAPSGVIAAGVAAANKVDVGNSVFINNGMGFILLFVALYLIYGGWKYEAAPTSAKEVKHQAFSREQSITLCVIGLMMVGTIGFRLDAGMSAFTAAAVLLMISKVDEKTVFAGVPWSTLVMVCGVGVLVNVIGLAGGIDLLTAILSNFANETTASAIFVLSGGLMSAVASASGVVMPTLIPAAAKLGASLGIDPIPLISSVVYGAHLTGISPFSTGGALTMSLAGEKMDKQKLFMQLLAIAMGSMVIGAILATCRVLMYI